MAFMQPEYYFGKMWVCSDCNSDACIFPWDEFTRQEAEEICGGMSVELSEEAWWVRLSASGYMDRTEWDGPYSAEYLARQELGTGHWEVHPDTGDEWEAGITDDEVEEITNATPRTDEGYPESLRKDYRVTARRRARNGVAPEDGGDYNFQDDLVSGELPRKPRTEQERMRDFFFPKRRGSFLMNLKSWK